MPHSIKRGLVTLAFSLTLIAGGLALWIVLFDFTRATPTWAIGRPSVDNALRYCANFDFMNNTGQDVDGLHLRLQGIKVVSNTYIGPENPFGAPDPTSGYDAAHDVYQLNFSNGTALNNDLVHLGLCSAAPILKLDPSTSPLNFYWTQGASQVLPNPLFAGLQWEWTTPSHLRIHIVNGQAITLTLTMLNLLDGGNPLTLDDLKNDAVANLPEVLALLDTPQTLGPQSDSFFDVFFNANNQTIPPNTAPLLEVNHPYIIQAELAADDSGNGTHLFAQGLSPQVSLYLPLIAK